MSVLKELRDRYIAELEAIDEKGGADALSGLLLKEYGHHSVHTEPDEKGGVRYCCHLQMGEDPDNGPRVKGPSLKVALARALVLVFDGKMVMEAVEKEREVNHNTH